MDKWSNNSIQFPRLISEMQAAGAFTDEVLEVLRETMDLEDSQIFDVVSRAEKEFEKEVAKIK